MKFLIVFYLALASVQAYVIEREGRITNGEAAVAGQFPFQVALTLADRYVCGASLIDEEYILTAAHCTDGMPYGTAYIGATKRDTPSATRHFTMDNITVHENWNPRRLRNDISIIKIERVELSSLIQTVTLPASSEDLVGTDVTAIGWGRTSDKSSALPNDLQFVDLKVISNEDCAEYFGSVIVDEIICTATTGGTSTCNGDSGGPLVEKDTDIQVGLVSFGASAGCEKGHPAAFTRIAEYISWIEDNTSN